jgi:hypothetical protein
MLVSDGPGKLYIDSMYTTILYLRPSSFSVKKYEIVIGNIQVLPEILSEVRKAGTSGYEVQAGWQLGTPKPRSSCEDFVRIAMRLISDNSEFIDPKEYLAKSPLSFPQWKSLADQWYLKVLGKTLKQVFRCSFFADV